MCNFTKEEQEYTVPETFAGADVLISNYPQSGAAAGAKKTACVWRQLFWKPNKNAEEPVAERTFATGSCSQNTAKPVKSKKGENKT